MKLGLNPATVSYWLRLNRFFPYIDEIALERALEGDRACFESLTLWELDLFYDGLQRRRLAMRRKAWDEWVRNFAQCIGLSDGGRIGDRLYKRYGAGSSTGRCSCAWCASRGARCWFGARTGTGGGTSYE